MIFSWILFGKIKIFSYIYEIISTFKAKKIYNFFMQATCIKNFKKKSRWKTKFLPSWNFKKY